MKTISSNHTLSIILILSIVLMLAGCNQPQQKPDPAPAIPQEQNNVMDRANQTPGSAQPLNNTMGQSDMASMMHNNPEAMQKAMSAPENRQTMINMMSSPQMRPAMTDMMKNPAMRQAMTDIMADPAMKDTFATMVKDPRLAPIARESLK